MTFLDFLFEKCIIGICAMYMAVCCAGSLAGMVYGIFTLCKIDSPNLFSVLLFFALAGGGVLGLWLTYMMAKD